MADVTTQAVSSPAEVADVFNGEQPSPTEFNHYRATGEVPERFKPAEKVEAAPNDTQEKTESEANAESADGAETSKEQTQEQPRKPRNAAQRIAQLESAIEAEWDKDEPDVVRIGQLNATIDKISGRPKRKSEVAPPPAAATESAVSTPQQPAQNYQEYRKQFKPAAWIEDFAKANPEASYEDATAAMADHLADARDHFKGIEQRVKEQAEALNSAVEEAKTLYEDFDEVKDAFLSQVVTEKGEPLIPVEVLRAINKSKVLTHIIHIIASDPKELSSFVSLSKSDPDEAIKRVGVFEYLAEEELSKGKKGEKIQAEKAPERQRTSAPKPPSPVGGGSSKAFDVSDDSLSTEEWARKRTQQLARKA